MKQSITFFICLSALTAVVVFGRLPTAQAYPQFFKVFEEKYVGDKASEAQKTLAANIERVSKCNVCHDPRNDDSGKPSKKNRNPYGESLAKMLTKDDKKDTEKITKSLLEVEAKKIPDSAKETIGALLKEGKLPFEYPESEIGE